MALATYSDLLSAVASWLNRGTDLDTRIPDFIKLAEAEFNRRLRTLEMEAATTLTLTGDHADVPADFLGLRSLKIDNTALEYVPPAEIADDESTGIPTRYTVTDGKFVFRPAPSGGTADISYYQAVPALTAGSPTNWLMTRWPDLYLFATIAHAAFYIRDPEMVADCQNRAEALIAQINQQTLSERHGGRRLAAQHRVGQVSNIRA